MNNNAYLTFCSRVFGGFLLLDYVGFFQNLNALLVLLYVHIFLAKCGHFKSYLSLSLSRYLSLIRKEADNKITFC